jgi:hypothetical protein
MKSMKLKMVDYKLFSLNGMPPTARSTSYPLALALARETLFIYLLYPMPSMRRCMSGIADNGIDLAPRDEMFFHVTNLSRLCGSVDSAFIAKMRRQAFDAAASDAAASMDFQSSLHLQTSLFHQLCPLAISFISLVICKYGRR